MNKEEQILSGFRDILNKIVALNKPKMEESLHGHKSSEVHCIEFIGKNADSNVTKLAESFFMTRSAISKITKKLLDKGLIESYQKPENKKEIYFRLTEEGQAINKVHDDLHQAFRERDKAVFEQVTVEQFESILSFVEKYNKHLDAEIKKQEGTIKPE
ncbi:MarR family transcriptional regulator [Niallia circulans]|uniref:MarR family transcriptional regulator n=1 Tax=Niallia circulans TaxID=1397 RepID=A0A553SM18_NIACI|nr:MarR family transcriptional regulator [Niallia circulans]TRZ38017.1 MarR family transcriptional regulator [Niallia circulans]